MIMPAEPFHVAIKGFVYNCETHPHVPCGYIAMTTFQRKDCYVALQETVRVDVVNAQFDRLSLVTAEVDVLSRSPTSRCVPITVSDLQVQMGGRFINHHFKEGQNLVMDVPNVGGVSIRITNIHPSEGGIFASTTHFHPSVAEGSPMVLTNGPIVESDPRPPRALVHPPTLANPTPAPTTTTNWDRLTASIALIQQCTCKADIPDLVAQLLRIWLPVLESEWQASGGIPGLLALIKDLTTHKCKTCHPDPPTNPTPAAASFTDRLFAERTPVDATKIREHYRRE
jgi:hypothetical protein